MITEAKAAGYAKQAPVFKDVPKQMKAAGMAASSRDAMIFILQVLSRLDVISPEEFEAAKKGQHRERMEKLMGILKNNEEAINAKEKDIVDFINNNLDNYTSAAGTDRGRVEKYKETAKKISKEVANVAAGKEADDALRDILFFVDETLEDAQITKAEGDTAETGPVRAAVDATMAELRKMHQDDPDDIPPYVIEDLEEITPKIERMDQLDSFIKQLAAFTKEDQYYEKPVIYFMDAAKKAKQVAAEDYEMEDGEGTVSHEDAEGKRCDYVPCEDGEHGCECEQCPDCMPKEDGEQGSVEEHYPEDQDPQQDLEETFEDYLKDIFAQQYDSDPEQFENFVDDIHDALGQQKEYDLGKGSGLTEPLEWRMEMGMDLDTAIEDAQASLASLTVSDIVKAEDEEVVAENKYTTSDSLVDLYESVKPIVERPTINENGQTTPTQQYLVESAEAAIEEAYTTQYLTEQKEADSLLVPKEEVRKSFKERYQPKTSYQLEELRRYGL